MYVNLLLIVHVLLILVSFVKCQWAYGYRHYKYLLIIIIIIIIIIQPGTNIPPPATPVYFNDIFTENSMQLSD